MSRFPLVGKHRRVECAKCHPDGRYKPVDTNLRLPRRVLMGTPLRMRRVASATARKVGRNSI